MIIESTRYVPTLAVRASEMNGLGYLPGPTKDRMTPCFLLAPWAISNTLDKTIERVQKAFHNRNYFLDIDQDYQFTNLERLAQRELYELLNPTNAFRNWVDFVKRNPLIMPCVQTKGQSEADIKAQILSFQQQGRTYCLRIERERFPSNMDEIVSAFASSGAADFAILLEGGWSRDPLSLMSWFEGIISQNFSSIDAQVPIVLSCTSMPKDFSLMKGVTEVPYTNRELYKQITAQSNRMRFVYGDWGSTRPRESGFGSRPVDRIDYPTKNAWHIARNKENQWSFQDAAREIVNDTSLWDGGLGIWGEELIQQTIINQDLGINTPQKNVAARTNIHLHLQAFYDEANVHGIDLDENWED